MWRDWKPAPAWTLALAMLLALSACSQGDASPTPAAAANVTVEAGKQPTPTGLCIPVGPLGVLGGSTWTIAGPSTVEGVRQTVTTTITVHRFETGTWRTGNGRVRLENSQARVDTKTVAHSADGQVAGPQEQSYAASTISPLGRPPVLTLDWDCHQQAWLRAEPNVPEGSVEVKHTVRERKLSSGVTAVLFTQTRTPDPSQRGVDTSELLFGYDKLTGRLVVTESHTQGTRDGKPYIADFAQELVD